MLFPMKFRWPDDPNRISAQYLAQLDQDPPGTFIAQPKYDGWRRPAYLFPDGWRFFAKRGTGEEAAKQPPDDLVKEFASLNWPPGVALDMEWVGPRCKDDLLRRYGSRDYNGFRIFDMLYMNGEWIGGMPFGERLRNLETIFSLASGGSVSERIFVAPWTDRGLVQFFEQSKQDPLLEGIVLKRAKSRLEGHPTSAKKNPQWFKVKWRDIKEPALF